MLLYIYIIFSDLYCQANVYVQTAKNNQHIVSGLVSDSRSLDQPMAENMILSISSHTLEERVTTPSSSAAGEPPRQGNDKRSTTLEVHINQSISYNKNILCCQIIGR